MPTTLNVATRRLLSDWVLGFRAKIDDDWLRDAIPMISIGVLDEVFAMDQGDSFRVYEDTVGDHGIANLIDYETDLVQFDPEIRALKSEVKRRVLELERERGGDINVGVRQRLLALQLRSLWMQWTIRLATLLNDTAVFTNVAATAAFGSAGDDPIGDMHTRLKATADACGTFPNTVIYENDTWTRWSNTSEVIARLSNTVTGDGMGRQTMRTTSTEAAERLLNIENQDDFKIYIGRGRFNDADKGQAVNMTGVWTAARVLMGYVDRNLPQAAPPDPTRVEGSPGDVADMTGSLTPVISAFGPDHGDVEEWQATEGGKEYIRTNFDYDLLTAETTCWQILTGA